MTTAGDFERFHDLRGMKHPMPAAPEILPDRAAIWPRRTAPGLTRAEIRQALIASFRASPRPIQPPIARKRPQAVSIANTLDAALRFLNAVGVPALDAPGVKAATVIGYTDDRIGQTLRLTHKGSLERLNRAVDALVDLLAAVGRDVRFRELMTTANIGVHRASLRLAPVTNPTLRLGRATSLTR